MTGSLASCSAEAGDQPRAERREVRAANAVAPEAVSTPLQVPEGWPDVLSVPELGELTDVNAGACRVNFMVPVSDALVQSGTMEERARAKGLAVRLISSDSTTRPVIQDAAEADGFLAEEAEVEQVASHVVVLELSRDEIAAGKRTGKGVDRQAVDATLTLTSLGDGVVTGEYALSEGTCAR